MKDKILGAVIRLAMCPGHCSDPEICDMCAYRHETNCAKKLKTEALKTLREHEAQTQEVAQVSLESRVTEVLHELGVPAHIKGFYYVREAILIAVHDMNIINFVTKELYPRVAEAFDTTPSRVERAIRHAVELAWERGDIDVVNRWFGYTVHLAKDRPTNSEFIALIADILRIEMQKEAQ